MNFVEFPSNALAPLFGVELDRVFQSSVTRTNRILVIGQKKTGTATAATLYSVTSADQAAQLFGRKSQIYRSIKRLFQAYPTAIVKAVGLADIVGGTAATFTITVTGPATADGTITLYIAGQRVRVSVLDGDAQNDIAAAINTALGLMPEIPFAATVSTNVVTLTAVHKGTVSNVTVRKNHRGLASGEALPGGVGVAIAQTATGATDPDIGDAFAALGADDAFRYILFPWPDDTTLDAVQAEMESRWGPTRGKRGHAYTALRDTHSNLVSAGEGRTVDSHISVFGIEDTAAAPAYELAASALGRRAAVADNSASKPPRGQKLVTGSDADDLLLGAPPADQFDWSERNTLLAAGLATLVSSGTAMSIERIVTLYKNNPVTGLPDTKFRDDTTLLTAAEVIDRINDRVVSTYPAHIIVDDGVPVRAGLDVVRVGDIRSTVLAEYQECQTDGLTRGLEDFKIGLAVEADESNANRINFLAPLRVVAGLYQVAGLAGVQAG